jgi:hypothetical protein
MKSGWNNRFIRPAIKVISASMAIMAASMVPEVSSRAQETTEPTVVEEPTPPEISREGWRERILEARRRAKQVAIERRANPEVFVAVPEDPARIATARVLNDESLQRGDIVSTKKGLFVFQGRRDQPRREGDFVAVPVR